MAIQALFHLYYQMLILMICFQIALFLYQLKAQRARGRNFGKGNWGEKGKKQRGNEGKIIKITHN